MKVPKLDSGILAKALVRAANAHDAVKQTIAEHAAAAAKARMQAHDKLHADNIASHKTPVG